MVCGISANAEAWNFSKGQSCTMIDTTIILQVKSLQLLEVPTTPAAESTNPIFPIAEGIHSKLSMAIVEKPNRLLLYPTVTVSEKKSEVCLANCLHRLLALRKTDPCSHNRKTALSPEYARAAIATSFRCPNPKDLGGKMSIVQTANSPTAQILFLLRNCSNSVEDMEVSLSMLCYRCCLDCAYEQARSSAVAKIIVA